MFLEIDLEFVNVVVNDCYSNYYLDIEQCK